MRAASSRKRTPIWPNLKRRAGREAVDAGINFIDTPPDYGDSEELIGESISPQLCAISIS